MKPKKNLLARQKDVHSQPHNIDLIAEEKRAAEAYKEAKKAYNSFTHQRAKMHWLKEGDANTKFFHQSIKARKF